MQAHVGDWLVIEGRTLEHRRRQGKIIELVHADGSPPYRVRWVEDDHESLVFPARAHGSSRTRCRRRQAGYEYRYGPGRPPGPWVGMCCPGCRMRPG